MARWLLKTEPDVYSFADLARDKTTVWDGVANALALRHIREMKKGDEAVVYHTGDEKAAVGLAAVASVPYPDPKAGDGKLAVVDLKAGKPLAAPVTLAAMRADPAFAGWDLLRIGRLSVVPVPDAMWDRLLALAAGGGGGPAPAGAKPATKAKSPTTAKTSVSTKKKASASTKAE